MNRNIGRIVMTWLVGAAFGAQAADRIKANNTTSLNTASSFTTTPLYDGTDVFVWDSTVTAANTVLLGGSLSVAGIRIANPGGAVVISSGNTLTLGASGIDMSSATQNLTINPNIIIGASQTWTVAGSRTLSGIAGTTTSVGTGTGNINMVQSGTGTALIVFNQNGNGTGWGGYSGNVTVNSNVKVQSQGQNFAAFGSGTITLAGGAIHQNSGTWAWSNNIDVTAASTIGSDSSNGLGRQLKLLGTLTSSNSSGLTFTNTTTGGTRTHDSGFILAGSGASTYTTTTISANSRVRVGGNDVNSMGGTNPSNAGTRGSLGTGDVTLSATTSELAFTWTDAHTVANKITGSGTVVFGGTTTAQAGTSTQVVTLSGASDYTGATTVANGRLNLTGSLTSAINVTGGSISGTGSTTGLLTMSAGTRLMLNGGATTGSLTANGVTFSGATTLDFVATPISGTTYDVVTYSPGTLTNYASFSASNWRGTLANTGAKITFAAGGATRTWNTTSGTWDLNTTANFAEGDQKFLDGDQVVFNEPTSTSSVTLSGTLNPASVTVNNTANGYSFSGSGSISGAGSLLKSGAGALTLANANNHTGGTTVRAGTVIVQNAGALGASGAVTLNDASTGSSNASLMIDATAAGLTLARAITVANQGSGTTTLGAVTSSGSNQAIFSGAITLNKAVTLMNGAAGDRLQFSGGITGTGDVTVDGVANTVKTVFITTANTFNGNVYITGNGRLQMSDGSGTALSFIPDTSSVNLNSSGGVFSMAKGGNNETIGALNGVAGTIVQSASGADTLTLGSGGGNGSYAGTIQQAAGSLVIAKTGAGTQTLSGSNTYSGGTTISAGTLATSNTSALGSGAVTLTAGTLKLNSALSVRSLANASGDTSAVLNLNGQTLTIGNATAGNYNANYYGKIAGTGTMQLRGGTFTIMNSDGTAGTTGNAQFYVPATAVMPNDPFALDTGASADRKDFGFVNASGDVLTLSSLTGYGAIRMDSGGSSSTRLITVDQSGGDTTFNGAVVSHTSSGLVVRQLTLEKNGTSALTLAGFIGKQTVSAGATASYVNLIANGGILDVTNPYNTTTTNTGAIGLGTVTITSGTLGFANQALVNTAGSAGATSISMNGGTLRWDTGNTQDITAGSRLTLVDGKTAKFDTNGNDVELTTALGGGAIGASVEKTGAGTLKISASNSYTGTTTVKQGTLRMDGSIASSTVTVDAGAKLQGSGSVGGLIVNGTVAPGNSIESLAVGGNLSLGATSTFQYELDSATLAGDLLAVNTGTLTISSGAILTLAELASGTRNLGDKLTLISYNGTWDSGLFTYLTSTLTDDSQITLGSNTWLFNYNDTVAGSNFGLDQSGATGFVTLTVIPEPATVGLIGLVGMMALLRRRMKIK